PLPPPHLSTPLFPYTTLFRSNDWPPIIHTPHIRTGIRPDNPLPAGRQCRAKAEKLTNFRGTGPCPDLSQACWSPQRVASKDATCPSMKATFLPDLGGRG